MASREMLSDCKQRDRLEKKAKKTGPDADLIQARQYRNQETAFKKNLKIVENFEASIRYTEKVSKDHGN